MAAEGSAAQPVVINDSDDDEKMDISEPPRRLEETETIDLLSDDDASEAGRTDEDDEAGGALETDQPLEKADEVEVEQPQIRASPWTLEKNVSAVGDMSAAWAIYTELEAASNKRLEIDGKTTPACVRNKQLQQNLPVPQALYNPPPKELDQFVKLLPVLFPLVELYKYGGAHADLAQGRSTNASHYSDAYFDRLGKDGSQGSLVLAWGYKDNEPAIVAENLLISQRNSANKNKASIGTCEYTDGRPGAVYAVPVLREIDGVAIDTKEDFLGVYESYYMKQKKKKGEPPKPRKPPAYKTLPIKTFPATLEAILEDTDDKSPIAWSDAAKGIVIQDRETLLGFLRDRGWTRDAGVFWDNLRQWGFKKQWVPKFGDAYVNPDVESVDAIAGMTRKLPTTKKTKKRKAKGTGAATAPKRTRADA